MKKLVLAIGLMVGLAAVSLGCDPGIRYRPRGWTRVDDFRWKTVVGSGVSLQMRPIGGLVGETWLDADLVTTNQTAVAVSLEGATLRCGRDSYPANSIRLFARSNSRAVLDLRGFIASGETREFSISWKFQKPIIAVLHPPVSLLFEFRIGAEAKPIEIPMSRQ